MKWLVVLGLLGFLVWLFWPAGPEPAPSAVSSVASPVPQGAAAPAPHTQSHPAVSSPQPPQSDRLTDLARREGVQAQVRSGGGNRTILRVIWPGGNAAQGGDFVMTLYRENLIGANFEQTGAGSTGYDSTGRRVWQQDFQVTMR